MKAYIHTIDYYLPQTILTNDELVRMFPEWSVEKIASKVGIAQRHIAAPDETALDMAVQAAERLFKHHNVDRGSIDYVLLCTQSADYHLPTSACLLQSRLGLRRNIGALDFNLGCSGYVYGLSLAKGLILAGIAKNVLLVTSETYSKYLHPKDKGNRTIFGDGASATLISTHGFAEIGEFDLGTDGCGANNLIVKTGGARQPNKAGDLCFDDNGNPVSSDYLYMNGSEIFSFTAQTVPASIRQVLTKSNLSMDDVNLFVLHQANKYMLDFLRKKLKISEDRFFINIENIGNTVSSTIPIALSDAQRAGRLHGNILLCGFGVGYSWGSVVLKTKS